MASSDSNRRVVTLLVCLVASVSFSCCKSYVRAHVPRCPQMNEAMAAEMLTQESATITYVADEIIPYCKGIEALREE